MPKHDRGAGWFPQEDMFADGDRALLEAVLVNLNRQCLEYASKTEAASIAFARHPTSGRAVDVDLRRP